jgi:hypothetical protein
MAEVKADRVFFGKREAMIAEVGAFAGCIGKYLVMCDGPAQFDTEGADTLADARLIAKESADYYGVKTVRVR